jgi:hypothetical protein
MFDPLVTHARRVERYAVIVSVIVIVLAIIGILGGIALAVVPAADCGYNCADSTQPFVTFGLSVIGWDLAITSMLLLVCSYIRMRAHATVRQFTPPPPPTAQQPWPPPPTAFS